MTFRISGRVLVLLLLGTADAFQNGNTPRSSLPTSTTTTTTTKTTKTKSGKKERAAAATAIATEAPMPFKWPIVGTLPDFISRGGVDGMAEVHESMHKDLGPVYKMSLLGNDEIVFSDPRVFDQILRREGKFPVGAAETVTTFREYYKENNMDYATMSIGRGPDWKDWRSLVNPDMFVLWKTYLPVIADTCSKISKVAGREVTETKNLHITDFLSRSAFDMFSAVLYGESPETTDSTKAKKEDIEFVSATKRAFDITGVLITNPLEKLFGGQLYKEFVFNMDKTNALARQKAEDTIRSARDTKARHEAAVAADVVATATATATATVTAPPEESDTSSSGGDGSGSGCPISAIKSTLSGKSSNSNSNHDVPTEFLNPSYIERLVNRGDLAPEKISEIQVPLLMAGVDTTAYVMSWFYLNMASNLEVQTELAKDLDEKLNGADVTTVEQMESLTYLRNCFRESHRLTPAAPLSIKVLEEDITVFTGDNKSYMVPAGQRMSLNLRGLPLDPDLVENPREFRPERFSEEAVGARKGTLSEVALDHPYMNDPFGRGKRRCLGANVAIAEMTVLAARLLQDYEITLEDPGEAVGSPTKTWSSKQKLILSLIHI